MKRLVLASVSPRRRELLQMLQLPFEVHAPRFDEVSDPRWTPAQEALEFAKGKARSLLQEFPDALVIGSDTLIAFSGEKIGKPKDPEDAFAILRRLAGKCHQIFTGVAVIDAAGGHWSGAISQVTVAMRPASDAELRDYVASGEPLDKAGAYAIQGKGRDLIAAVEGDYFAAVGLPLRELAEILAEYGMPPPISVSQLSHPA
ncbi:MAG: Maf family protein [bacterium]